MTPLELAARSLCNNEGHDPDRVGLSNNGDHYWTTYVGKARAVLEALREPSEAMLEAVYREMRFDDGTALKAWQRMIDAALEEG
ncbi:hypothetical protein WG901_22770 [Novosphingobium sp. PS1R-30]|uniref:Uncharacterized protein n=1 Tax=Novosphingobium anseongense TaxID=3133436 RepID=A0ABU8S2C7_9SPHN